MLVTGLTKKGSNVEITFREHPSIIVKYEVVIKSRLRKNDEVDEKIINDLKAENEIYLIKETSLKLLGRRQHSIRELKLKLIKKKYDKQKIEEVIEFLLDKNLLNDKEFSKRYAEEKILRYNNGVNKTKSELFKKGVDRTIIDEVLSQYEDNPVLIDNAVKNAEKKLRFLKTKNLDKSKLKQRIFSHLMSKGFRIDIIKQAIDNLDLSEENDSEFD
jgi:regulatory protein